MTSEKFPDAFKRFEKVINTTNIRTFQQLLALFSLWGGRNKPLSPNQISALKDEAKKRKIVNIS